jgi:F0F1-type ATP synthase membrane subunit b/b'
MSIGIIIAIVVVAAIVLFLVMRFGKRRQVKRLEGVSDERRQQAKQHNIRAAQLEQELERERSHAEQHSTAARDAEEKLADKR